VDQRGRGRYLHAKGYASINHGGAGIKEIEKQGSARTKLTPKITYQVKSRFRKANVMKPQG